VTTSNMLDAATPGQPVGYLPIVDNEPQQKSLNTPA